MILRNRLLSVSSSPYLQAEPTQHQLKTGRDETSAYTWSLALPEPPRPTLRPEAGGLPILRPRPRGGPPPHGVGLRLRIRECGDPNPRTNPRTPQPKTLSLREVNSRSGIDLGWLKKECEAGRIGEKVEGVYRVPEGEVDRIKLRWLRVRRAQVNRSKRGFRRGGNRYTHDGSEAP